ncbi:uncharacterized protein LOC120730932 isoform X2 [Simochromis diagramma]|uniref:uncharacterized protein LOC120730932 isoform X2 n=1 Tax=Simochromis diagramma TaxID=43689 RepID=UPI001A7E92D8|nr:uncharacterized protein LOC120730932 isoform X2 [Simochromis diagramma]
MDMVMGMVMATVMDTTVMDTTVMAVDIMVTGMAMDIMVTGMAMDIMVTTTSINMATSMVIATRKEKSVMGPPAAPAAVTLTRRLLHETHSTWKSS